MKKILFILLTLLITGCQETEIKEEKQPMTTTINRFPNNLLEIPNNYFDECDQKGTLVDLYYDTYESFTYEKHTQPLKKHAIVYLPYGYSEDETYPTFYLMHGGWSNEYTYLGSPERPHHFKHVLDHGMKNGEITKMIVVCPTYNNLSNEDSGDYSLAIQLTNQYHNELINDLIPAIENNYNVEKSRDYRAFCGFSMGSVATWRTFEHCLDDFRYFMPSSGSFTNNLNTLRSIVEKANKAWNDFFIFAASGQKDFAYSAFKQQIDMMASDKEEVFRFADNEQEGNLYYLENPNGSHTGEYAMQYFYNGLCWLWK